MKTLAPTHTGVAPQPADAAADTPLSRVGRRLVDLDGLPVTLPSDAFCGRHETLTRGEWLRRHAETYGVGAA